MSRKTGKEARAERLTWFALVMVFLPLPLNSGQWMALIPAFMFPAAVGIILFMSGIYQYRNHWRVSPFVWVIAAAMLLMAGYAYYTENYGTGRSLVDPILVALIGTIIVIVMGVLSNES